ncbi:cation:proton antiporter [Iodidimonas nitroreducens]|uniref:Cation:proton antiporter n=1 Tax=Iodidimonas nitroreducens TaxID=1236968 RepID=A0A5A7N594_9PROT|nr:monovalent cation/H+ antiporter subunit D family protein [Iodidimonas nitroreducens]GAK32355.1 NADH-quinone oxidoreductase subunit N [alpha proteobacterium Q-1]GER03298.1 cation:proton antiporter [Iodidimonas nitroreducens]
MTDRFILSAILLIPAVAAILIAFLARFPNLRDGLGLIAAFALTIMVWCLLPGVMAGDRPQLILFDILPHVPLAFRIEPLGMVFAALASLLWIISTIYSIGYMRGNKEAHQGRFFALFAVALFAVMGVAMASNLLTLFIFYEVLTLSTYPLVTHKGDANSMRSGRVYFGVLIGASIGLFLPAIIWTYSLTGTLDFQSGGILDGHIAGPALGLMLGLYVFGVAKAAVMPFHKWLPAAMVAPTPVSALLHAVAVVKAGVFTITKVIILIFGYDFLFNSGMGSWLVPVAAFTIIAASLVALQQTNLKRMLAYSTISQLSYIVMATAILAPLSQIAAILHIVAHAFGKITLFFAAGSIYTASKKTEITQLNGIGLRMPITMGAFAIGALSMIGVPPTAGFVSKWYLLSGAFAVENYIAIGTVVLSTALNAGYFLPIIFRAFFRAEDVPPPLDHKEANVPIRIALIATSLLVLVFFVFNGPVIDLVMPIVEMRP